MASLTKTALLVLEARYLRRDAQRRIIESPDELFARVARGVAHAELLLGGARQAAHWAETFESMLAELDFLPNTPTLANAGTALGQLSACFVLPIEDTMEGIFGTLRDMALVQRTGGGTGFSFSRLRPRGATVVSTGGVTPGPVAFMKVFDCATENVRLGGRRRGANMGILRVDHPDILEFIEAKSVPGVLRNFNLSVGATDAFMEAVAREEAYDLVDPRDGRRAGRLGAREVFEAIAAAAWRTGDPGMVFLDEINRRQPTPRLGRIEATNPCGEVPLLPYESCNLGSINLANMLRETNGGAEVDHDRLGATVRTAVRFLDDVIEVGRYPVPAIEAMTLANRKIGLGVMGFAELLIRKGIAYDSDEAEAEADRLMSFIAATAREASAALAAERGPFPNWKGSALERQGVRVRNATQTAIAPTGTISMIAGTSASIEPLFALAYRRRLLEGQVVQMFQPLFLEAVRRSVPNPDALIEAVARTGRLADVPDAPAEIRRRFVTALDVPADRHLRIQAAFQRHVDNSVSKTINLPPNATPAEVANAYRAAWEMKLKGITVFRHGSRPVQVVEPGTGEDHARPLHGTLCGSAQRGVR